MIRVALTSVALQIVEIRKRKKETRTSTSRRWVKTLKKLQVRQMDVSQMLWKGILGYGEAGALVGQLLWLHTKGWA